MSPTEFTGLVILCIGLVGAAALCLHTLWQNRAMPPVPDQIHWIDGEPDEDAEERP